MAVRERSVKLGDETEAGNQRELAVQREKTSCLSGTGPELGNNLHMLSSVGLKVQLNLWDGGRRHIYRGDIF